LRIRIEKDEGEDISKALVEIGDHHGLDVVVKARKVRNSVYTAEKPAVAPRKFILPAANSMFDHWDSAFKKMIDDIKSDIEKVLK